MNVKNYYIWKSRVNELTDFELIVAYNYLKENLGSENFDKEMIWDVALIFLASGMYGMLKDYLSVVFNVLGMDEYLDLIIHENYDLVEKDKIGYVFIRRLLHGSDNPLLDKYLYDEFKNSNEDLRKFKWFYILRMNDYNDLAIAYLEYFRCKIGMKDCPESWMLFGKRNFLDMGVIQKNIKYLPTLKCNVEKGVFVADNFITVKDGNKVIIWDKKDEKFVYDNYVLVDETNENIYGLMKKYGFETSFTDKLRLAIKSFLRKMR